MFCVRGWLGGEGGIAQGTHFVPADAPKLDTTGGVAIPMQAGSMILIHGQLVHWSLPNTSDKSRNAFSLHVIEGRHAYPADNWLQRFDGKDHMRFSC